MTAAAHPVTFFGYWSGQLPAVTDLHFRSFLRHHPDARYELWLDEDDASDIAAPELQWIRTHARIAVRPFSLNALIEKHVSAKPVAAYDRLGKLRKAASSVHRKVAPQWARRNAWEHELFGLTYKHSSMLFGGFTRNKAYRGDLARCLVAVEHYADACLYADLDVCFTSDLTHQCADKAWAYRWEKFEFANSALLYLPNRSWSAALTRRGNELENFLPWILFTDQVCAELGIVVHPTRLFDPLWDATSLLYGDPNHFFGPRSNLALDLHALSVERHLAIHWHNNWKTVPDKTSIYAGLLKACDGVPA
jgi:hypothetical protein